MHMHALIAMAAILLGLSLPVVESFKSSQDSSAGTPGRISSSGTVVNVIENTLGTSRKLPGESGPRVEGEKVRVTESEQTAGDVTVVPVPQPEQVPGEEIKLTAKAATVMDIESGNVLFNKAADEVVSIASITKLFTALAVVEREPEWDQVVTMAPADEAPSGGSAILYRGEQVTVRDLWYLMLVRSDNNAARALARSTGLSEEEFVAAMNEYPKRLGLERTVLREPTGLVSGNVSTPSEAARTLAFALENEHIREALTTQAYQVRTSAGRVKKIENTDRLLLTTDVNMLGGKTGSTDAAGYCLVVAAQGKNGQRIIVAVFGTASDEARFSEAKKLIEWTWSHWKWPSEGEAVR